MSRQFQVKSFAPKLFLLVRKYGGGGSHSVVCETQQQGLYSQRFLVSLESLRAATICLS